MAQSMNQKVGPLRPLPCLTVTESSDELASLCEQVNDEVEPIGFMSAKCWPPSGVEYPCRV
jgi:hypothetical protein